MSAPPLPLFKKTCPCTILPLPFLIFQISPCLWQVIKIYFPLLLKRGEREGERCGRYYFDRYSSELAQLVPLPSSWGRSTHYSDRLYNFSVNIPRCCKDVYVNSFFACTAGLWNSLPIEYFPLTYDLSVLKSRINRHLLTVGSL